MKFLIYQATRQGGRSGNEDRIGFSYSRDALLMVVADGMGGHLHGEVAAQIAVGTLTEEFRKLALPHLDDPAAFLRIALQRAHRAINLHAAQRRFLEIPHTTCVAALVQNDSVWWAHTGDSRLYFIRGGKVAERTEDHSAVAKLVKSGAISAEEASVHPERNRVTNCLGGYIEPEVEVHAPVRLRQDDTLLLCTDGLWGAFGDAEICEVLGRYLLQDAVNLLMDRAEYRGGDNGDNLSLVAMRWGEGDASGEQTISTQTLTDHDVTTLIGDTGEAAPVSDDEIERAIAEIQQAIRKSNGEGK